MGLGKNGVGKKWGWRRVNLIDIFTCKEELK